MRERPILFNTGMVRAILEGRKAMTRRIIKEKQHGLFNYAAQIGEISYAFYEKRALEKNDQGYLIQFCPYGQIGDVLWVREEYYQVGHWEPDTTRIRKSGRQAWKFVPNSSAILYSDNPPTDFRKGRHSKDPYTKAWHKRIGRFMPKSACRIKLRITSIIVERLNHISEEDAIKEGIQCLVSGIEGVENRYRDYSGKEIGSKNKKGSPWDIVAENAIASFKSLWESINGKNARDENHWVWVIEFERIK